MTDTLMIRAKVIAYSKATNGKRIATVELMYPRFIHGEVMTHRVFSRNAMSSRAVPVAKMIKQVEEAPVIPLHWGMNQAGMQAEAVAGPETEAAARRIWLQAAHDAAGAAAQLNTLGLHKQVVNRLLEPFQWMRTIITSTEWDNFFELRIHKDAEPHMRMLAEAVHAALDMAAPVLRFSMADGREGAWHLPYITQSERSAHDPSVLAKMSAARCARVSYLTHDGLQPSMEADLSLYDRLAGGKPIHASPLEHQAMASHDCGDRSGNFFGWVQFRQLVEIANVEAR